MKKLVLTSKEIESLNILIKEHYKDEYKFYHELLESREEFQLNNTLYHHWTILIKCIERQGTPNRFYPYFQYEGEGS